MNWLWLAGFCDGEAWFGISRCGLPGRVRVQISQSGEDGLALLEEIRCFLLSENIKAYIAEKQKGENRLQIKPAYHLAINSRSSALRFLQFVLPHLRLKRTVAQDLLRYARLYPPRRRISEFLISKRRVEGREPRSMGTTR